ncbi:MAG: YtxH domain-containing protein [Chloroflexi bacterium]|nr:YtxH domain-containing protein [Chloroflexota bacterium]
MEERARGNGRNGTMVGGVFLGMLIGAATGLAIGFLYAPRSGKETRGMIKAKATETTEMIKERADETREKAGEVLTRIKTAAVTARAKGREAMEEVKHQSDISNI